MGVFFVVFFFIFFFHFSWPGKISRSLQWLITDLYIINKWALTCSSASACLGLRSPTLPLMTATTRCEIKTELLQSQINRQRDRNRNSTVTVNRDRRISVSDASQWCSSTASVVGYPRCQLPAAEKAAKERKNVNRSVAPPVQDPVQPADWAKDQRKWQEDNSLQERGTTQEPALPSLFLLD